VAAVAAAVVVEAEVEEAEEQNLMATAVSIQPDQCSAIGPV
jgi:hypothetical protein